MRSAARVRFQVLEPRSALSDCQTLPSWLTS
jgi:hypothetical protein